ncbi:Hint domain-containing protein [Yoonia tamlensis]|uniref:Hint domain-containing protein n=1 Tax=Yoonia tamlensis TaxID=390270 RepID=A0A1I6GQM7_9RHOB|nr:Hint domain-containing protein [Yoonia tamlensis]SFR44391.1 Hint domain-containing protein [Yoonia tamlensis]
MVAFNFTVPIYGFDQWVGASTNNTISYPNGTTMTLNSSATLTVISVTDDDGNPVGSPDNYFSDGYIDTPGNGSSPSTGNNDQLLSQDVTINGTTYLAGSPVELEFGFTTSTGETFWIIRIDGDNVGISGPVLPTPGTTYTVNGSADGQETPVDNVPCFVAGTLITTSTGPRPIESLEVGDLVLTKDNGLQPILWIGKRALDSIDLAFKPNLRPIRIAAGSMGAGLPKQDLLVSPQHRMLVRSEIAQRMFGTDEVLVAAKSLVAAPGVASVQTDAPVCYMHMLFDAHQVVYANDAPSESLYTGPEALKSVPAQARKEIFELFPELKQAGHAPQSAAFIPKGQRQRGLVARHVKNGRALVS